MCSLPGIYSAIDTLFFEIDLPVFNPARPVAAVDGTGLILSKNSILAECRKHFKHSRVNAGFDPTFSSIK